MDEVRRLQVTAFISGAAVMVVEILGSRLFAPYFGSSTYVWSALIGVILASLSLGYYIGGREADVNPSKEKLSIILFIAGSLICVIPALAPRIAITSLIAGYRLGPLIFALMLFTAPNILLGMVPPYTIKLAAKNLGKIGSVAGDLYALSTVGSIVGTLLTGFVFIPLLPVTGIFVGVTVSLFLASFLIGRPTKWVMLISLAAILIIVVSFGVNADEIFHRGEEVVYEKYTPYHRILVLDDPAENTRRMMLDAACPGKVNRDTNLTEYCYINFFELPFLLHRNISSVYMIGEGTGVGAVQIKINHPQTRILVTEIDPEVHNAAVKYFNFREGDNLQVEIGDGRQILKQSAESYDLVILDAFTSVYSIPTHLTTLEFFHEVKTHLKPDGIFESNVITSLGEDAIFLQSICKTMGKEFKYIYFYQVDSTANKEDVQNIMLIASNQPLTAPTKEELDGYDNRLFDEDQLEDMLGHGIDWFSCSNGIIISDDYSPTDYLMEPMLEKSFAY